MRITERQISKQTARLIIVLALLMCGFIFFMSSRDVNQSLNDSIGFDRLLASWLVDGFDQMNPEEQYAAALLYDEPIRHVAHTTEFAVLGALLALLMGAMKKPFWPAFALGAGYGVFDEIHQLFVAGRGCQISDMCFDALGVLLGILIVAGALRLRRNAS